MFPRWMNIDFLVACEVRKEREGMGKGRKKGRGEGRKEEKSRGIM